MGFGTAVAAVVGGTTLVVGAPFVLAGIGFTGVGIAAGSYAASMMSAAALANAGGVAAGSTVAVLQSAAMAGIPAAANAALGITGAALGVAAVR
ncbi:interferon alpha-inducible protein 27-like protein 2A [Macrobrachium rosenbergii]|uniref:interferon alpha-inducible protein 27-like protein 2A n=1 Tax=Macrobrachium rosenbergii TaxID=79674 RepID=UPI0034D74F1A